MKLELSASAVAQLSFISIKDKEERNLLGSYFI